MPDHVSKQANPQEIGALVETLRAVKLIRPDLRLGQIIVSAASLAEVPGDAFYITDDVLIETLRKHYLSG